MERSWRVIAGLESPRTEQAAREGLSLLWFGIFALNVLIVLVTLVLGGFGPVDEEQTHGAFGDAIQSIFYIFGPNLTLVATYWYALRDASREKIHSPVAFRVSWIASLLWALLLTTAHALLKGFTVYSDTLPRMADMGNWLIAGLFGYYFAKSAGTAPAPPEPPQTPRP